MAAKAVTGAENVRWDLSFLYTGLDDPQLMLDVNKWCAMAEDFHRDFKGRLSTHLGDSLEAYTELDMLSNKVQVYLYLRQSTDTGDQAIKAKLADVEKRISAATADWVTFYEHEIVALSDEVIAAEAAADPIVRKHLPELELIRVFKKHMLPEPVEAALMKRSPFSANAWSEFFDEVEADLRFPWKGEQVTLTELLRVPSVSTDPAERALALKTVNDGLNGPFLKYSAQTLAMVVGKKEVEDKERGYRDPMERVNKAGRIPDEVVEALHEAVVAHAAPLCQRYYRLKAKLLGLERLAWSDRNAPMPFADSTVVTWEKSLATVLAAYESFSPTLANLIRQMVADRRIDAPAATGKRGGAFNYSVMLPGGKPASFVFLNFQGTNDDTSTLAHEVGHGCHGLLAAAAQGALMFHAPMAYAETASVFGEMTTFNFLKAELVAKGDDESLLALLTDKIDGMLNTVVRQIGFSNFERRVHGAGRRLTIEEYNTAWLETAYELYGPPGDVFTYENSEHLWAYVSHFHRPFYVYAYAFGELLTQSLYAKQREIGSAFEPLYLDMLRTGGTLNVVNLLKPYKPYGLDPVSPDFWASAIRVSLGTLIDEAEQVARRLGKIAA